MNMAVDMLSSPEVTITSSNKLWAFPWWGVWSLKAAKKLLEILHPEYDEEKIKLILEKNDWEIRKAWNPAELAEALSKYIGWYVLIPIKNNYEWNVEDTLYAVMEHYKETWEILRMIWNVEIEIKHCLVWKPGQSQEDIKNWKIYSHIKAIEQCSEKIDKMWIEATHVGGTANASELERAKNEDGVFLLIDKDTAEKEWLENYDEMMWPENNFTTFAIMTSDPNLKLNKEVELNKDFSVGLIKVNKGKWWLLSSLLPLLIMEDEIDMKTITSSLNWDKPMIWFVSNWKTVNDYHEKYRDIVKGDYKTTRELVVALYKILKNTEYQINFEKRSDIDYILTANNKPWALIKMLLLFEQHNINIDSINSEIEWDKVKIYIQTRGNLDWFQTPNMPGWSKEYLGRLVEWNRDKVSKIMCL